MITAIFRPMATAIFFPILGTFVVSFMSCHVVPSCEVMVTEQVSGLRHCHADNQWRKHFHALIYDACVNISKGNKSQAETLVRDAISCARGRADGIAELGQADGHLACILDSKKRYSEAETYYLDSLKLLSDLPDQWQYRASHHCNYAHNLAAQGRYEEARDQMLLGLPVLQKYSCPTIDRTTGHLSELADIYVHLNNLTEAETVAGEALQSAKKYHSEHHKCCREIPEAEKSLAKIRALTGRSN